MMKNILFHRVSLINCFVYVSNMIDTADKFDLLGMLILNYLIATLLHCQLSCNITGAASINMKN